MNYTAAICCVSCCYITGVSAVENLAALREKHCFKTKPDCWFKKTNKSWTQNLSQPLKWFIQQCAYLRVSILLLAGMRLATGGRRKQTKWTGQSSKRRRLQLCGSRRRRSRVQQHDCSLFKLLFPIVDWVSRAGTVLKKWQVCDALFWRVVELGSGGNLCLLLGGKVIDSWLYWCFLVWEWVDTVRLYHVSLGRQEFSLWLC